MYEFQDIQNANCVCGGRVDVGFSLSKPSPPPCSMVPCRIDLDVYDSAHENSIMRAACEPYVRP